MVVDQFKWFCEMVTVCHNNFRVIAFNSYDHPLTLFDGINFISIYNNPDI